MIDYENTVQKIIKSLSNIVFEFDIETLKKEMELQEVSITELEKLGYNGVKKKFNNGTFKIKLPNGNLIDSNSIYKHCLENNIKEPVIFINPNYKYVQWFVKKNFTTPQIKNHIKNQLTSNTDINLAEVQKALLIEEVKNKKVELYIDELPIKTSNSINEGKFYIQSSCSRESAIKMVNEVIEELKIDSKKYIKNKFNRDYVYLIIYLIFTIVVSLLWLVNKEYSALSI
jgi:hypothetical protein